MLFETNRDKPISVSAADRSERTVLYFIVLFLSRSIRILIRL